MTEEQSLPETPAEIRERHLGYARRVQTMALEALAKISFKSPLEAASVFMAAKRIERAMVGDATP